MPVAPAALLLTLLAAAPATALPVATSPAPEAVSVTVYRDPSGGEGGMNLEWLNGYALITETRTVSLPAGDSVVRFEGVAGNIIPVSAILRGLPRGVGESNYDARLLSAGALVDAALGRQVHVRRTNPATGRVEESEAIVRSGPQGIVLQSAHGIEALGCSGLPETLVYSDVPPGLSAKPTLAMNIRSGAPVSATVQLSYLATQFDWRANYVVSVAPDGKTFDLFAWLTLANGNDESFDQAGAQVVAGRPNWEEEDEDERARPVAPQIELRCWPAGRTSDPVTVDVIDNLPPALAPMQDAIVVTGSRITRGNFTSVVPVTAVTAELEPLGDVKLYRVPIPVTVAAHAQKQVALLHREKVLFERLYSAVVNAETRASDEETDQARILLRMRNVEARGLGKPLPAGGVSVFEDDGGRPMLVGNGWVHDTSIGEDLEVAIGQSPNVAVTSRSVALRKPAKAGERVPILNEIAIANARAEPAEVEVRINVDEDDYRIQHPSRALGRKNGMPLWRALVPANGTARLTFTMAPRGRDSRSED
ncbi:MAG: hypothetical protein QOH04_1754 [Sphingomonadales bacterium]|nr:hypothetical protein [Sphingomonadales bacterium]